MLRQEPLPIDPDELEPLRSDIARWRAGAASRARMPAPLWEGATALARRHGVIPIARALELPLESLYRHLRTSPRARTESPLDMTSPFIELHPASASIFPESAAPSLELLSPDGFKLTLRWPAHLPLDIATAVEAFRRAIS